MNVFLKRIMHIEHCWKLLVLLALATIILLLYSANIGQLLTLMINAYALVALAAMLNRSSTRSSWVYHGMVLLASSVASYWVFRSVYGLVATAGLTYVVAVVYIAATTWGNFTGSKFSIFLEKKLGVKARWKEAGEPLSKGEKRIKIALLVILGVLCVALLITTRSNYSVAIWVLFLNFLNSGIHTFVRRSRNVGHTLFHNSGLLLQGLNFFLLFRFLAQEDMSWIFFLPFAMGGILGGLFTQKFTIWAEKKIKVDPDSHLTKEIKTSSRFPIDLSLFPWKILIMLSAIAAVMIFIAESPALVAVIIGLAVAQYVAFTLISRARTRKSRTYEAYASMASNGTWLAMFGKLSEQGWGAALFMPYIAGVMIGGNLGIGIARHIEKWFHISLD